MISFLGSKGVRAIDVLLYKVVYGISLKLFLLPVKTCASCHTRRTPLWRDAEDGTPLCNACGIRSVFVISLDP